MGGWVGLERSLEDGERAGVGKFTVRASARVSGRR